MKQRYSRSLGVDGSGQYASAAFDGQADSIQCSSAVSTQEPKVILTAEYSEYNKHSIYTQLSWLIRLVGGPSRVYKYKTRATGLTCLDQTAYQS